MKKAILISSLYSFLACVSPTFASNWGELEGKIKDTLESLHLGRHSIENEYRSGKLKVTGYVTTPDEKSRVIAALGKLDGITEVEDGLDVKTGATGTGASDDSVKKTTLESVKNLKGLGSYEIDVAVEDGKIFLSGTAASEKDRKRIEQAAHLGAGNRTVENRILLTPPLPDDEVLENTWAALRKERDLDLSDISIACKDGVVTVAGKKSDHKITDRILSIVNMVDGVREVKSEVRTK